MSAYLKFFELDQSPFDTGPQSSLVLGTPALRDAFAQIEGGLAEGAPRICVSGRSGLGKTSLARALPKLLRDSARVVLLLNPSLPWATLRGAIIRQLDLPAGVLSRESLLASRDPDQKLVIVVDAAERIAGESLEHLDILLGYRTDDDRQLVHCVLLANLEHAREQSDCPLLWWLDSLHTLQLEFAPIPASGVHGYIVKHLKRAGWKGGELFTQDAARTIHRITGGVPRSMSELCDRVLEAAAERGLQRIDAGLVGEVCGETSPDTAHGGSIGSEEMLLDDVVEAPRDDADAEAPGGRDETMHPAPAVDSPQAQVSGSPTRRGRGLDAFFGPEAAASRPAPARAPTGPESQGVPSPFEEDPDVVECDAPLVAPSVARRPSTRLIAIAAALVAVAGVGGVLALVLSGGDADPEPTAIAGFQATSARPTPAERIAEATAPASPSGPIAAIGSTSPMRGDTDQIDAAGMSSPERPDGTHESAVLPAAPAPLESTDAMGEDAATAARPGPAPPASAARGGGDDRLYVSPGRHE